ncbi:MAG: MFS transporter [Pseudomonadota bacterium]
MAETDSRARSDTETFVSWREILTSAYLPSLVLVCLAVWLHAADGLIVATMLPSIVAQIGGGELVGWSVSVYEIGSIVAGAASALLTVRFGLRTPMTMAAILFGCGCVISAVSANMPTVLFGRALQGLGGGALVAMSYVAVGVFFPRRYIARAMAAVSTFWGASAFLGPLIGGFFVEFATWRWGFAFFGLQAFALAVWIGLKGGNSDVQAERSLPGLPIGRLLLLCLSVLLIAYGGVDVALGTTTIFVSCGIFCMIAFLLLDGRAGPTRLMPLSPFDIRYPTGAALVMILCISIAAIAITAFGPILVVAIHGASALTAGYIVACSSIGWTVTALAVSGAPERHDRSLIALGIIVVALSVVGFVYAVPNGPIWLIALFAAMEGGGFGIAWTFILRRATALADANEIERIAGAIPTIHRLGYALGAAYIGIVANAMGFLSMDTPAEAAQVAHWVFVACLPFAILSLIAMFALVKRGG